MDADFRTVRGRERVFRRLMGLPAVAPDPVSYRFEAVSDDRFRMVSLSEDERAAATAAWHAEDFRADVAEGLARLPRRVRDVADRAAGAVHAARAARRLSEARTLRYTSHYVHGPASANVEGYFDFGDDITFSLTVISAGRAAEYATAEWERGDLVSDSNNLLAWGHYVVVPGDTLTPELVEAAIRRWYTDRFEYARGHWTHVHGGQPELVLDLAWDENSGFGSPVVEAIRA